MIPKVSSFLALVALLLPLPIWAIEEPSITSQPTPLVVEHICEQDQLVSFAHI